MTIQILGVTLGNTSGSSLRLADLADVSIASPQVKQYLRYDSAINKWQNVYLNNDVFNYLNTNMSGSNGISIRYSPGTDTIDILNSFTVTGDATGELVDNAVSLTLATVNSSPQTNQLRKITVNSKGLTTQTSPVTSSDINSIIGNLYVLKTGDTLSGNLDYNNLYSNTNLYSNDFVVNDIKIPYLEGRVFYLGGEDHTLCYYNDEASVTHNIGQELWVRVRNISGSTILNGYAVYISGTSGGLPIIELANSTTLETATVLGIATHDIENNSFGYITSFGIVRNINTSSFGAGTVLYLSTTPGILTDIPPISPNFVAPVAIVVDSNDIAGTILVNMRSPNQPASDTVFLPSGSLTATNVQSAIEELNTEKLSIDGSLAMSNSLNMGSFKVINTGNPSSPQDVATKYYVDSVAAGSIPIEAIQLATTTALPTNTPAGSGVGKTLTGTVNGQLSVDGVPVTLNNRILVKNENGIDPSVNNGVYTVTATGTSDTPFILTRASDFNSTISSGATAFILEGVSNLYTYWTLMTPNPITIDVTPLTFVQTGAQENIIAGTGLTRTASTLSVNMGAGIIELPSTYVGVDIHANGGLFTTVDNISPSTSVGSQLAVKLDGITLSKTVSGLKVANSGITEAQISASVAGGGLIGGAGASLAVGTASSSRIVINSDNIDIATVADSGTGSFLKFAKDTYGRVTGTTPVTSSDIAGLVNANYVKINGDTMTGLLNAPSFIPTSSTIPSMGLYAPTGASVGISTNSLQRLSIGSDGLVSVNYHLKPVSVSNNPVIYPIQSYAEGNSPRFQLYSTTAAYSTMCIVAARTDGGRGILELGYQRGTTLGDFSTGVPSGVTLGDVRFSGSDTIGMVYASAVRGGTTQTWTGSAHGSNLKFATTANNATTPAVALTIDHDKAAIFEGAITSKSTARFSNAEYGYLGVRTAGVYGGTGPNSIRSGIVLENNGATGISILTPNTAQPGIAFGDPENNISGQIRYSHTTDAMEFITASTVRMTIEDNVLIGQTYNDGINKVQIAKSNGSCISLTNGVNDNVNKSGRISVPQRLIASTPFTVIGGLATSVENIVEVGGGSSSLAPATTIRVYTDAFLATPDVGTQQWHWDSTGALNSLQGGGTLPVWGGITARLNIGGTTSNNTCTMGLSRYVASNAGPALVFGKSRSAASGSFAAITTGDTIGNISWYGADGTDGTSVSARIRVDAAEPFTPTTEGVKMYLQTTALGTNTFATRVTVDQAGIKVVGAVDASTQFLGQASDTSTAPSFSWTGDTTTGMYRPEANAIGFTTASVGLAWKISNSGQLSYLGNSPAPLGIDPVIVVSGGNSNNQTTIGVMRSSANSTGPRLIFAKSRGNTPGTLGAILTGDILGDISFVGDDGAGIAGQSAMIRATASEGFTTTASGANIAFWTATIGANTVEPRFHINSDRVYSEVEVILSSSTPTSNLSAGYRGYPVTTTTTISRLYCGWCKSLTAGFTILPNVFEAGDEFKVYNNSGNSFIITQGSGLTMYGNGGATGNRTLAARGICTIWFASATTCKIYGEIT